VKPGQGRAGVRLSLAAALPGASYNDVSDEAAVDALHQRLGAAAVEGLTSNTAGSLTYTA